MTPCQVFLVEDQALIALELSERLAGLGYTVSGTANTHDDALAGIQRTQPDIVLSDIRLIGDKSGIDLARTLRTTHPDLPFVVLSAYTDRELLTDAIDAAVDGYLVKPYDEQELHTTLQTTLARAETRRQERAESAAERARLERFHRAGLDRLAGGVAHVFSTRVAVALTSIELAQLQPGGPPSGSLHLRQAEEALLQLREGLGLLRSFAGGRGLSPTETVDLHLLLSHILPSLRAELPEGITLHAQLAPVQPIQASPTMLTAALAMLLQHRAHARRGRPTRFELRLETSEARCPPNALCLPPGIQLDGPVTRLRLLDNGEPPTPGELAALLFPFGDATPPPESRAAGLPVVAARQAGGFLSAHPRASGGSELTWYLPPDAPSLA